MNGRHGHYRRFARVGKGGWRCYCCAPPPGDDKKREKRREKRSERQLAEQEIRDESEKKTP